MAVKVLKKHWYR